jgi:hypothetical protein
MAIISNATKIVQEIMYKIALKKKCGQDCKPTPPMGLFHGHDEKTRWSLSLPRTTVRCAIRFAMITTTTIVPECMTHLPTICQKTIPWHAI